MSRFPAKVVLNKNYNFGGHNPKVREAELVLGKWYHGSTLVLACCEAEHWSHGKKVNIVQPQSAHPQPIPTKIRRGHYVSWMNNCAKFGGDRINGAYTGVKYTTFVRVYSIFSFPFLSFPFLFLPSPAAWTDFHVWWLKMRELVQGRAFFCVRTMSHQFWG